MPHETYVNNNYMVLGRFVEVKKDVAPWLDETKRTVLRQDVHTGRKLEVYYDSETNSFDVLFAKSLNHTNTSCNIDSYQSVCVGKTTPANGLTAHFSIECGSSDRYFGTDPYALSPTKDKYRRPWICQGLNDTFIRPVWKLLGYFPTEKNGTRQPCKDLMPSTAVYANGHMATLCREHNENPTDGSTEDDEAMQHVNDNNTKTSVLSTASPTATRLPTDDPSSPKTRASWMSRRFGIAVRIPGGCHSRKANHPDFHTTEQDGNITTSCEFLEHFNVSGFVQQVQSIGRVGWVIFGLSGGGDGLSYTSWHSILSEVVPGATPPRPTRGGRDLFRETATALQNVGIRTIAYVASEGPAKLKKGPHGAFDCNAKKKNNSNRNKKSNNNKNGSGTSNSGCSASVNKWIAFVEERYNATDEITLQRAFAEVIVAEFAYRYNDLVSGWWFDHGAFADKEALVQAVREGNPNAAVAFSAPPFLPLMNRFPGLEDFTAGHPRKLSIRLPSDERNVQMVESVESTKDGYLWRSGHASLGHILMPMIDRWGTTRSNTSVWTIDQAQTWMSRVLESGGAWTWAGETMVVLNNIGEESVHNQVASSRGAV